MNIAKEERIARYFSEEYKPENKDAERMGRREEKVSSGTEANKANLKRFTLEELNAIKDSTTISYEFYCLVKAEILHRVPVVQHTERR